MLDQGNTALKRISQYVKYSLILSASLSVLMMIAHVMGWTAVYLTSPGNGTSVQTAILSLITVIIVSLDRLYKDPVVYKIKFTVASIMLVYLLQNMFDPKISTLVDSTFSEMFSEQGGARTSFNTKLSMVFIMMSAAMYAAGNKVLSLSTSFVSWLFPLMLMYDSMFWGSGVLGGMSYQTGTILFLIGTALYAKRIMYPPFISQIETSVSKATVVRLTFLGVVMSLTSVTLASSLTEDVDHIIPLLGACFIYQHVLFNSSTRMTMDLQDSAVRNKVLYEQSITDSLTGVRNRGAIKELLSDYRGVGIRSVGVMLFDLDFFKLVNDRHGHAVGDEVLIDLCSIVQQTIRKSDILIRWGGEEFLVIVPTDKFEEIYDVAEAIRHTVKHNELGGVNVTLSAGVAVGDLMLFDSLITRADKALYYSKQNGRDRVTAANKEFMETGAQSGQFLTLREIEEGLLNNEMFFMFQPIIDTTTGRIKGIECLLRWERNGEIVTAGLFADKLNNVMLANPERNGKKFCQMMSKAIASTKGLHPDAYLSFNINITQLYKPEAIDMLLDCMSAADEIRRPIMIEILESPGLPDMLDDVIISHLKRIKDAGHQLALDDFGVEDSNLVRLISLPIDVVKIDMKVTKMIHKDNSLCERTLQLLAGMNQTFKDMHVDEVVIEGVENEYQICKLEDLNLAYHQGFAYHKPLTIAELAQINRLTKFGKWECDIGDQYESKELCSQTCPKCK